MFQTFHYLAPSRVTDIKMVVNKYLLRKVGTVGAKGSCVQICWNTQPKSRSRRSGKAWDSHNTFALQVSSVFLKTKCTYTDIIKVNLKRTV